MSKAPTARLTLAVRDGRIVLEFAHWYVRVNLSNGGFRAYLSESDAWELGDALHEACKDLAREKGLRRVRVDESLPEGQLDPQAKENVDS